MLAEAESPAVITLFTAPWSDVMNIEINQINYWENKANSS